jgi:peptide/nickel transport system substrate-binding protein
VTPVLAACGGDEGSAGSGDGEPQRGGRLRVGVAGGGSSDTLDAHDPTDNVDIARNFAMYASLMRYAGDGTIEPHLAESLEANDDGTEWTLVLKEGLAFHDDSPVTSDSVAFSLRRILDPDDPMRGAGDMEGVDPEALEAVDERTPPTPSARWPRSSRCNWRGWPAAWWRSSTCSTSPASARSSWTPSRTATCR